MRIPILESAFPATQRWMKQTGQKGVAFKLPQINSTMSSPKATAGGQMFIVTGMRERERENEGGGYCRRFSKTKAC
jgi:hypothetical protein